MSYRVGNEAVDQIDIMDASNSLMEIIKVLSKQRGPTEAYLALGIAFKRSRKEIAKKIAKTGGAAMAIQWGKDTEKIIELLSNQQVETREWQEANK